jgi:subtilase family serine protease
MVAAEGSLGLTERIKGPEMSRRRRGLVYVLIFGVAAATLAIVLGATTAAASSSRVAVGSAARLPVGARFGHALPVSRRLRLTIALQPRDAGALTAFATAVSTPGTPRYGHILTVAQFAQRFGATSSQLAAVATAMRAGGLHVGAPTANHLTIPVSGTVAEVQRAFSVTEAQVRLPGGRVAFANDRAPRLAAGIARSVQGVLGLDDVSRQQPQGLTRLRRSPHRVAAARPHAVGSGPAPCPASTGHGGYTADQIASAYGMGSYYPADEGAGETVALVEFEAYDPNDIAMYQACYQTSTAVTNVDVDGGPGAFNGSDGESTLDIDQITGLAPQANVLVYQAPLDDTQAAVLNAIASQDIAKVVSSSWGGCESQTGLQEIKAEATALEEMAAQGQSFFNSSGDSGSTMCYQTTAGTASQDDSLSVIDPGSQPFATGVGGTFLGNADGTTPTDGSYTGEGVWNDGGADAAGHQASGTGGGVSPVWPMPSYQSGAVGGLGVVQADSSAACGGFCRQVPDVSADADPNSGYVVYSSDQVLGTGWMVAGGTSASAPLWAAFTALANASPACRGFTLGFENPALYAIAGSAYAANFHDVTGPTPFTGAPGNAIHPGTNDTWSDSPDNANNPGDLYPVLPGYDMATGLGSPIANALGNSLCALRAPAYTVSVAGPGNQLAIKGHAVSLAVHGTDSGNAALTYSATGLPAGLSINAATGVISGAPSTAQTATVTVRAGDAFANAASTSFNWTVVAPGNPQLSTAHRLSGLGKGRPKLTVSVAAGAFAPALKSVTIRLPGGLSFAKKAKSVTKGITVKSASKKVAFSAKVNGGALIITFKVAVTSASVRLVGPTITISKSEATKIRKHKVPKLKISLKATDASNRTTGFSVTFKKPS